VGLENSRFRPKPGGHADTSRLLGNYIAWTAWDCQTKNSDGILLEAGSLSEWNRATCGEGFCRYLENAEQTKVSYYLKRGQMGIADSEALIAHSARCLFARSRSS
jgi:hypothetical protein